MSFLGEEEKMRQTLRHEGDNAKNLFKRMVTNVRRSNDFSIGDTEVNIDSNWYHVEVKDCQSNTINQVRAIKYQTLVIYNDGVWYVIPPQEVVRLVAQKSRGQHTEIPFECANLALNQIQSVYRCSDTQLAERVYAAIRMGQQQQFKEVKKVMEDLYSDLIKLKERTKSSITSIFEQYSE
jgi:hypothetical protein